MEHSELQPSGSLEVHAGSGSFTFWVCRSHDDSANIPKAACSYVVYTCAQKVDTSETLWALRVYWDYIGDNGKENGNDYNGESNGKENGKGNGH